MTARGRRRVWFACAAVWLTAGGAASWLLRDSVAWVNLQSWLALVLGFVACGSGETPVEVEE